MICFFSSCYANDTHWLATMTNNATASNQMTNNA